MKFRPSASWALIVPLIFAPLLPGNPLLSVAVAQDAPSPQDDAARRLQWLKSKGLAAPSTPAKATPAPNASSNAAAGEAILKKRFAETRAQQLRPLDAPPAEGTAPAKKTAPATTPEKPVASAPAAPTVETPTSKPTEKIAKETKPSSTKETAAVKETSKEKDVAAKTASKETPTTTASTAKTTTGKDADNQATASTPKEAAASKGTAKGPAGKESSGSKTASTAAASVPTREEDVAAKKAAITAAASKKTSANEAKVAATATPAPESAAAKSRTASAASKDSKTAAASAAKDAATKTAVTKEPATTAGKTASTSASAEEPAKKSSTAEKTPEKKSVATASVTKPQPTPAPTVTAKAADSTASRMLKTPATTASIAPSQKPIASTRPTEATTVPHGMRVGRPLTVAEMDARLTETRPPVRVTSRYPWKTNIVTTVFWVGERPSGNNFTPNYASSWDRSWSQSYGGFDNPDPDHRRNFIPIKFTPRQNPFYVALPYNDVTRGTTKPESRRVIPWFKDAFEREGQSVCHNRWVAIRSRSGKIAYAQWSDCGPFRTDHWQYVFGNERPKPNLNQGAGLDVSPAVRDYLGIAGTDVTDWRFVEAREVPYGPWALYGDNNNVRRNAPRMASKSAPAKPTRPGSRELAAVQVP